MAINPKPSTISRSDEFGRDLDYINEGRDNTPHCPKCGSVSMRLRNHQTGGRWLYEFICLEPTCYAKFAHQDGQLVEIFVDKECR